MEIEMEYDPKELREEILENVLGIYNCAAAANDWTSPPKEIEEIMDDIFRLVTLGLGIKE